MVEIFDEMGQAAGVLFGDFTRIGGVLLGCLIITGVATLLAFVPKFFGTHSGTTFVCKGSYYILPYFTDGINFSLAQSQMQCLVSNPLAFVAYYFEILGIAMVVIYLAILFLHLDG